ncbi:MAG TPA: hypothetical protein VIF61_06990 [Methylocystis sp.]|jgi:hypothetical protein
MNELIVLPNPPGTNVGPTGAGPDEQEKSRLKRQSWRRLGLAACALALTLGTGWAVGTKSQSREAADSRGDTNAARKLAADEAERGDIRALREEIRALQAKLDSLDKRSDAPERGTLEAKLNSLDRKIEANHVDAANVAVQIAARLEKNDKSMERLEAAISANSSVPATANNDAKGGVKPAPKVAAPAPAAAISAKSPVPSTASNDAKGSVKPAAKVAVPAPAATTGGANVKAADAARPTGDYTVREVQDGIALVQGRAGGLYEVGPGDRLPGAGRVLAVEKIGQKWVVVTESGRIDGQAPALQPRYSQRRDPNDYYFDQRF